MNNPIYKPTQDEFKKQIIDFLNNPDIEILEYEHIPEFKKLPINFDKIEYSGISILTVRFREK